MDGALWLLLRLRLAGVLRRWGRSLRTMKGLLLALVGSLLYLPMLLTTVFAPRVQLAAQLATIRRYGVLGLFGFCVLNLILASDERAVYFAPAEIEFLFSGPFRRRQLLLYKMVSGLFSSVLVALLMTFFFAHHAPLVPARVRRAVPDDRATGLALDGLRPVRQHGRGAGLQPAAEDRARGGPRGRHGGLAAPGSRPLFRRWEGAARPARRFAGPAGRGLALPPAGDGVHGGASLARAGRLVASGPGRAGGTRDRRPGAGRRVLRSHRGCQHADLRPGPRPDAGTDDGAGLSDADPASDAPLVGRGRTRALASARHGGALSGPLFHAAALAPQLPAADAS